MAIWARFGFDWETLSYWTRCSSNWGWFWLSAWDYHMHVCMHICAHMNTHAHTHKECTYALCNSIMHQHTGTHMYIHTHVPHTHMPWFKQLRQRGLGINMLPRVGKAARNVKLGLQNLRPNLSGIKSLTIVSFGSLVRILYPSHPLYTAHVHTITCQVHHEMY